MNRKDIESIMKAKRNEIKSKGLEEYYGASTSDEFMDVREVYPIPNSTILDLSYYLEATKVPKYVRLARFLREIHHRNDVEYQKTVAFLKHVENKFSSNYNVQKTTYKEFKQIEKRNKKLSIKAARKLNRYKDVRKFINHQHKNVLFRLREQFPEIPVGIFSVSSRSDIDALTEFFDNCSELNFLNNSRLTKRVK